jgi:hypothetical protein
MSVPRIAVVLSISLFLVSCSSSASVHTGGASGGGSVSSSSPAKNSPPSGWRKVSLPSPPGGPPAGYTDSGSAIACSSETECIFGSTYLDNNSNQWSITVSTTNGGLTWARTTGFPSSLDGGVASVACDQRYCFMLAQNAATTDQAMARTNDNGKTWTLIPYPPSWAKDSIDGNIMACSSSRCLVFGDDTLATPLTDPSAGGEKAFAATSNDFQTWTAISIPDASQIDQLACIWSGQCWAEYETSGDDLEHLATTLDGGVTWTSLGPISSDEAINNNSALSFALDPDHQVGLACENSQTCFILDNSNDLVTTHDGGRTWSLTHGPSRGSTDAITCTPSSTCWIVSVDRPTAWIGLPPA